MDNYTFIAQNMAAIYSAFLETDFGKSLSDDELLFAAAFCDSTEYIVSGQISIKELAKAVHLANIGEISICFYSVRAFSMFEFIDHKELIALTLQITALMCWAEYQAGNVPLLLGERDYKAIVDATLAQKERVSAALSSCMENVSAYPLIGHFRAKVNDAIHDEMFRNLVISFNELW